MRVSDATQEQIYHALASTVRDQVMERRTSSRGERKRQKAKKVYYLSAEFLTGRAMHNNMINLLNEPAYVEAMKELGVDILQVSECEPSRVWATADWDGWRRASWIRWPR